MANIEQRTPEWEEMRRKKIGASDAPVLMNGIHFKKTPYKLWEEKIFGGHTISSPAIQRGNDLEPLALQEFCKQTGLFMAPDVVIHPKLDWMMASLDGIDLTGKAIVEIKCPGAIDHAIAKDGEIPEKYKAQLQHQLEVCQIEKGFYFSFDGKEGIIIEVYKDGEYIQKLLTVEEEFMNKVRSFTPPELTEWDHETREEVDFLHLTQAWEENETVFKAAECRRKELQELIKAKAGGQSIRCGNVQATKFYRQGTVNYKAIPELKDVDLNKYRKPPQECWRISTI